jgi:hypothetical protein
MYLVTLSPGKDIERFIAEGKIENTDADKMKFAQFLVSVCPDHETLLEHHEAGLFTLDARWGLWNGVFEPMFFLNIMRICVPDLAIDIAMLLADVLEADAMFLEALHKTNFPSTRITDVYNFTGGNDGDTDAQEQELRTFGRFLEAEMPSARISAYFVGKVLTIPPSDTWSNHEEYLDMVFEEYRDWLLISEGIAASFRVNHRDGYGMLATKSMNGYEGDGMRESP